MLLDQRDLDLLRLIGLCKDIPVDCSPLHCDMFSDTEFSALAGAGYIRRSKSGLSYRLTDKGYALLSACGLPAERDKHPVGNGGTLRRRLDVAKTVLTSDELYGLLHKGSELVSSIKPILTAGGDAGSRHRVAEVSHMAALLGWHGIPTVATIPPDGQNGFIPSAIWRTLRNGIIGTTRFLGVLFYNSLRLAVYHIGDGDYEWQLRPECSLHFSRYDSTRLRLTGILLVCDDGCSVNVGKQIIRRTLWERETLLKRSYCQNTKPVRYSTSPVRVRADYKHAYLTEEHEITKILDAAQVDPDIDKGEYEHHQFNLYCDLLALAHFYSDLKRDMKYRAEGVYIYTITPPTQYHLHLPERYAEWGTFLKLPVTVHTLTEEDIHCLTT